MWFLVQDRFQSLIYLSMYAEINIVIADKKRLLVNQMLMVFLPFIYTLFHGQMLIGQRSVYAQLILVSQRLRFQTIFSNLRSTWWVDEYHTHKLYHLLFARGRNLAHKKGVLTRKELKQKGSLLGTQKFLLLMKLTVSTRLIITYFKIWIMQISITTMQEF